MGAQYTAQSKRVDMLNASRISVKRVRGAPKLCRPTALPEIGDAYKRIQDMPQRQLPLWILPTAIDYGPGGISVRDEVVGLCRGEPPTRMTIPTDDASPNRPGSYGLR